LLARAREYQEIQASGTELFRYYSLAAIQIHGKGQNPSKETEC